jgi:NADPH2:quinone reductase
MHAIRVATPGGPDVLAWTEVPDPVPASGEVLVRIEAAGINFIDVYHRTGAYAGALPFTPGQEAAGTVAAVGHGVTEWVIGDRVAYCLAGGAYAELAIVPQQKLVKLPASISTREGAAVMLQGMTAHYLACSTYPLSGDSTCVIHAAAGGVGLLLVQIAKLRGARVVATVSTPEKARLAKEAGADIVVDYTRDDFSVAARDATDGRGVQVVYDGVGKATFDRGLNCLAPRGMMVLFGQASGAVPPLDPQVLNTKGSLFLTRPTLGNYLATREELSARADDLLTWMSEGKLHVRIDREVPLKDASAAHRALEARETSGKILLIP